MLTVEPNYNFLNSLNFGAQIRFQQKQKSVKSDKTRIYFSKPNKFCQLVRCGTFAVFRPENSFMAEKPPQKMYAEIIRQESP